MKRTLTILTTLLLAPLAALHAVEPFLENTDVFTGGMNGIARYRIPGIVVTTKGTALAYSEARKNGRGLTLHRTSSECISGKSVRWCTQVPDFHFA